MKSAATRFDLASTFVRLGNDARVEPLAVDGKFWDRLARGELGNFHREYLVASHSFEADWPVWEMHPEGDELVCVLSGEVTFVLEQPSGLQEITLDGCGAFAIVPRGIWHTAKASNPCRMLFITAGEGTQHRKVAG